MAHVPPKLGPFEPLHRLGAGGMAETFLAVRRGPGGYEQRVCIKRILPAYESDRDFVDSFLDEARTSAALRHANIVSVVEFGLNEADGSHYLALELVEGMDLRALMLREQSFDAELVTLIACELAAALAYAHTEDEGRPSVVHRDLSPSNVLISRAGEVKLTDFGIARVTGGIHRTASGVIKGKVPYMPPEYVNGGRFDARGDLFSLGVMLYELCHGYRPFDGGNELDTMQRIASGTRQPFAAPAPRALITCVERLLELRPEDRFADAQALLEALPAIAMFPTRKRLANLVRGRGSTPPATFAGEPGPAMPGTTPLSGAASDPLPPTRTLPRAVPWTRRRTALAALALSLAVLAVATVLAVVRAASSPSQAASLPAVPPPLPDRPRAPEAQPGAGAVPAPPDAAVSASAQPTDAQGATLPARTPPDEAKRQSSPRPPAELRVVVYPFGDVWVDGKFAGQSPLTLRLAPGKHEIAVGEGRARERRTVRLRSGDSESLTFRAGPRPE